MRKFSIPTIEVTVWNRKNEFQLGYYLRSLTQPEITRQIPFELIDIEYDIIKDKISRI